MHKHKKKLLYVLPKLNYFNEGDCGRVTHALGVSEGFEENGWEVEMLSGNGLTSYREYLSRGIKLSEVNAGNKIDKLCWSIRLLKKFYSLIIKERYDLFIIRYSVSKLFLCWIFALIAKNIKLKSIIEVNSFAYHHRNMPVSFKKTSEFIENKIASQFDIVYAVSASLANSLKKKGCKTLVVSIPNGTSSNAVKLIDKKSENYTAKVRFVYLGSLQVYYDFDIIITAFKKVLKNGHDCELHFVGDGKMRSHIKKLAKDLTGVVFHGRYRKCDIGLLLNRKTDILVLPPKVQSDIKLSGGLSTKLFEYMSLNLPIIAPNMGEITDVLENGHNAILYKYESVNSLSESYKSLLDNPNSRNKIAHNAYIDFIKKHTWRARMHSLINAVDYIS